VIKFSGGTCAEQWRRLINGAADGVDEARTLAVDDAGRVVAAGYLRHRTTREDFTVVQLAGADGTELWRREVDGGANGYDEASAVTLTADGDELAAGMVTANAAGVRLVVMQWSGADGTERWREEANGTAR